MTRDDIIKLAREAGIARLPDNWGDGWWQSDSTAELERFAALVAAAEREECARVCDSSVHDSYIEGYTGAKHSARRECAAAIRARGEQK